MKIGLAFGGGATRGMAHLGVLSVLVDAGIPIYCVSGCSAGSVIGAVFCAGLPLEDMKKMAGNVRWRRIASRDRSRWGLFSFDRLERWLMMVLGDIDFSDLEIPLAIVTADVSTGERIVLRKGRLAKAVHASCAVPGIVNPVQIDGRTLMDGGMVDNLPVTAAREMSADYVIGIDVFEPNYKRDGGPLAQGVMAIETLIRHAGGGIGMADYLISPNTAGRSFLRFSQYPELISLGERAAWQSLPSLLASIEDMERTTA
ncbi:MAG: patatin-like phospholipase family protein [Candidatus Promineifilaceae bacterium]